MELDAGTKEKIESLIKSDKVVLFMKGSKMFPQCGFSATCVGILNDLVEKYQTVNILEDPALREGIKVYSEWPTIPQLYVSGEFVGGCDIVKEMYASGDLHKTLGVKAPQVDPPRVTITGQATAALKEAAAESDGKPLRVVVSPKFQHDLYFADKESSDLEVEAAGFKIIFDRPSAERANGLTIDFVQGPKGAGFKLDNPNMPAQVKSLTATELKAKLDAGEKLEVFDARNQQEREIAKIEGTTLLDQQGIARLEALPRDTPVVFHCHHGGRSMQAAIAFVEKGFRSVYNLTGGIDAWSSEVDPTVPRY